MHFFLPLITLFFLLFFTFSAFACEPCAEQWDLNRSLREAELVIIGQRSDFLPEEREKWRKWMGPSSINVRVESVLKGDDPGKDIKVKSWSGMCAYGISVDDKRYVMVLKKDKHLFNSVNYGCAFKVAEVNGDNITVNGETISIEDLKNKVQLKPDS